LNFQHRILNEKDEETEIAVECSVLDIGFLLDIGRSMFDVHLSKQLKAYVPEPVNSYLTLCRLL